MVSPGKEYTQQNSLKNFYPKEIFPNTEAFKKNCLLERSLSSLLESSFSSLATYFQWLD